MFFNKKQFAIDIWRRKSNLKGVKKSKLTMTTLRPPNLKSSWEVTLSRQGNLKSSWEVTLSRQGNPMSSHDFYVVLECRYNKIQSNHVLFNGCNLAKYC